MLEPLVSVVRRSGALLAWFAWAWLLAGCAGLPARTEPPPTRAFIDDGRTALGRLAAASLAPLAGAASGFRLLPIPDMALDARLQMLRKAERSIDAQCYHIHNDHVGLGFLRELRQAAGRGVRVRLLLDDLYTGEIRDELQGLAAFDNVELRLFNPLPVRQGASTTRLLWSLNEFKRVNHRMHNKLLIADGALALFGGRNLGDEYFLRHGRANFIDLDVIAAGQVTHDLAAAFDSYWNSPEAWPLQLLEPPAFDAEGLRAMFDQRMTTVPPLHPRHEELDPLGQSSVAQQMAQQRLQLIAGTARVNADAPSKASKPVVANTAGVAATANVEIMAQAREEVVIVSPYFLPGEFGMRLIEKAQRDGVRMWVVTNSLGSTDEPLVHRSYSRYRSDMVRLGVMLYEVSPTVWQQIGGLGELGSSQGRLHAKVAAVDRRWLLVGSGNLDPRSARLNTELGVIIDSPPLVQGFLSFMSSDRLGSLYQVQLDKDGRALRWLAQVRGQAREHEQEPHDGWWLQFKLWLQSLFVDDELL